MALEFTHGTFQWSAASPVGTDLAETGLGFAPKAIRFYWVGISSTVDAVSDVVNSRRGVGFASNVTGSIVQRAVGTISTDASGSADCGAAAVNNGVVVTVSAAGAVDGYLSLQSFDADGFTCNIDDQGVANVTVFWEAWGGSDITNVTIGDIAEPAATGDVDYTATGFTSGATDQVVMFAGCQSTAALNSGAGTDSGLCVGFASSGAAADNVVVTGNSDDGSATMDTDGYCQDGECLAAITVAGGNPDARAQLTQFGTDNFRLNWIARALTNRRNIFMAIKGGSWKAGSYVIDGSTISATATVSGLSFTPKGLSLIGRLSAEQTAGTSVTEDQCGFGTGTSTTSRRSMGVLDRDGVGNAAVLTIVEYDSVLAYLNAASSASTYDINAMNSDGFQIIVDIAGGVASEWQGYLTFGDAPVGGGGGGSLLPWITQDLNVVIGDEVMA